MYDEFLKPLTDEEKGLPPKVISSEYSLGAEYGYGNLENKDNIPSKPIQTASALATAGLKIWSLVPFVSAQYLFALQNEEASDSQNLSGEGYFVGSGLKIQWSPLVFHFGYQLLGSYNLAKKTRTNYESVYSQPSGYFVKVETQWTESLSIYLHYTQMEFLKNTLNEYEISGRGNLRFSNLGAGLGLRF